MEEEQQESMELGERAYHAPAVNELEFHPDLMTPDRLIEMARRRGVRVQRDERGVVVVCADCEGQIAPLAPSPIRGRREASKMSGREQHRAAADAKVWGPTFALDLGQLLADTVRHGVMQHDDVLSGAGRAQA